MPPEAHTVPLERAGLMRLPGPEQLLRAFLDAVADSLPRRWSRTPRTSGPGPRARPSGRARRDAPLALRRAAGAWAPLTPLLSAAVPDAAELADCLADDTGLGKTITLIFPVRSAC